MVMRPIDPARCNANDERVDSIPPVFDPFMSWERHDHWCMGDLAFVPLPDDPDTPMKTSSQPADSLSPNAATLPGNPAHHNSSSPTPPPLPIAIKHRRCYTAAIDEHDQMDCEHDSDDLLARKIMVARKLGDDFDRMALEENLEEANKSPNSAC